jgi:hypothetical protein
MKFSKIAAAAVAANLGISALAFAQDTHVTDAVTIGMHRLGYEDSVASALSPEQMLEVESVLNSSDSDNNKKDRIDQIIDE